MTTTPPTLVSWNSAGFSGTTDPKTVSVTTQVGDLLVAVGTGETTSTRPGVPTGGTGVTWTQRQTLALTNFAPVFIWTAPVVTAETFTFSISRSAGLAEYGGGCFVLRNHGGLGASNNNNGTSGSPAISLTTTGDNSLVIQLASDWNTVAGPGTYPAVNVAGTADMYTLGASGYYAGHWTDVGAAGAKTLGLTAPTGTKFQILAIEILGLASGSLQKSAGFFAGVS